MPGWAPCVTWQLLLVLWFTHDHLYMSMLLPQFVLASPLLLCPPDCLRLHLHFFSGNKLISTEEFFRQEYWSGLPFPSPGDLPDPGVKPRSPTLQADTLPPRHQGNPHQCCFPSFHTCALIHNIYFSPSDSFHSV